MTDTARLQIRADSSELALAETRLKRLETQGGRTERATDRLNNSFITVKRVIAGLGLAVATRKLTQYADQWINLNNRLRLVTDTQVELAKAQTDVFNIAQETRTGLIATNTLYTRLAQNVGHLVTEQTELADITRTINQAVAISGATVTEANGAIIQLTQGIASGTLRGEEFNSVMENTPRVAQAIADSLGVAKGELRDLAFSGKLTSDVLVKAFRDQAGVIDREFGTSIGTVSQSFLYLENVMIRATGNLDDITGASALASSSIKEFANSIDALAGDSERLYDILEDVRSVATLLAAVVAGRLITSLGAAIASSAAFAAVMRAYTLATTGATVQTNALGVVVGRTTATMTIAAGATRALGVAMRFLGGPAGLVILAATALYEFSRRSNDAEKETRRLTQRIDDLANSFTSLTREQRAQQIQANNFDMSNIRRQMIDLQTQIQATEENARRLNILGGVTGENPQVKGLKDQYAALEQQLQRLGEEQQALFQSGLPAITGQQEEQRVRRVQPDLDKSELREIDRLKRIQLAQARAREDEFNALRDSLKTEEEIMDESYTRRYGLVLEKTRFFGAAQRDLLNRLNEQFATDVLEGFGSPQASQSEFDKQANEIEESFIARRNLILENTRITEEQRTELELELTRRRNDQLQDLENAKLEMISQSGESIFGNLSYIAKQYAGEQSGIYRGLFAASKAFAIAESAIKIQQGIAAAASQPWPVNLTAIASTVAATASIVSTIQSTSYSGAYDNGGRIPSGSFGLVGEYGPELVEGPVTVRSRRETAEAFRSAQQGNNQMTPAERNLRIVNVIDPSVVENYLGSASGEELILNVVRNNPESIQALVG